MAGCCTVKACVTARWRKLADPGRGVAGGLEKDNGASAAGLPCVRQGWRDGSVTSGAALLLTSIL